MQWILAGGLAFAIVAPGDGPTAETHARVVRFTTAAAPLQQGSQQPPCQMKVVSCNYAYLYSGSFNWSYSLNGQASQRMEQVQVVINNGVGNCTGQVRETEQGQTTTGTISGAALVAVEFELDSLNKMAYRITVACPSVAGMGSPVQPAELGHHDMETYQQPSAGIAMKVLKGGSNYPAPETDPVNNVTGTVQVTWSLTRP